MKRSLSAVLLGLLLAGSVQAAPRYTFDDRADGISCAYYDVGLGVPWPRGRPDGADADGRLDGPRPYATERLARGDRHRVLRMDVTALVREWLAGRHPNDGLLVQMTQGSYIGFESRHVADVALRPQLLLVYAGGRHRYVEPAADAALDCSSLRGLGQRPVLMLKGSSALALRFDLVPVAALGVPERVELVLVRVPQGDASAATLVVRRLVSPIGVAGPPRQDGIASRYRADAGIGADPDVLFADGFESRSLDRRWTRGMAAPSERVERDDAHRFEPLVGAALRVKIPKGRELGLDLRYGFKAQQGREPDEIYFRYYLRLADDWLSASDGGKMPGLAGTYGMAAWGGRPWNGFKGWSMRGSYRLPPPGHPASGRVMLGTYAYDSKTDKYGEPLSWPGSALAALIEPDRWVCIEQHLRLNTPGTPGKEDGLFQVWVDGRLVMDRENLRLRDAPDIHIQEVWMNFFHGGTAAAPADMHAYIDNVVVARRYIGPLAR
jgi:hypothetical protein